MKTNKTWQTVVAIAVFMVVIGGFGAGAAGAQTVEGDDRAAALRILELVNRDRAQAGLPALADRADVTAVAAAWSASMAQAQVLSHSDDYFSRESHQRLNAKALGENVARNGSVDDAHARLMASPGHHANIMSTGYTVVGIAVFRDARGTYWVTQDFLLPKSAPASAAPAPVAFPAPKPAPSPRPVTPVAAPQPAPAPPPVAPPATFQPVEAPARATVDTALIAADISKAGGGAGWGAPPSTPIAAGGAHLVSSHNHLVLAAAAANALVALALVAARRRRAALASA